jgi:hypothetical protein
VRAHVQQGRGALANADLELAGRGLDRDRAARDLADTDVAAGGLGIDPGVRPVDGDVAVGGAAPQAARDLTDPGVALRFFITAVPSISPTRTSPDPVTSASPTGSVDGDIARAGRQLQRARLVQADMAGGSREPALAGPALAAEVGHRSTYGLRSITPSWHHSGAIASAILAQTSAVLQL